MANYSYSRIWTLLLFFALTLPAGENRAQGVQESQEAKEVQESFNVTFFDRKVKVVAPLKFLDDQGVILHNSTLGPLYGKIQLGEGKVIVYFNLKSETHKSFDIGKYKMARVFIIPLNPPGQEIELKLGSSAYEIPAQ